jgi:hypothetical protein
MAWRTNQIISTNALRHKSRKEGIQSIERARHIAAALHDRVTPTGVPGNMSQIGREMRAEHTRSKNETMHLNRSRSFSCPKRRVREGRGKESRHGLNLFHLSVQSEISRQELRR